jgi:hypothetical protein
MAPEALDLPLPFRDCGCPSLRKKLALSAVSSGTWSLAVSACSLCHIHPRLQNGSCVSTHCSLCVEKQCTLCGIGAWCLELLPAHLCFPELWGATLVLCKGCAERSLHTAWTGRMLTVLDAMLHEPYTCEVLHECVPWPGSSGAMSAPFMRRRCRCSDTKQVDEWHRASVYLHCLTNTGRYNLLMSDFYDFADSWVCP